MPPPKKERVVIEFRIAFTPPTRTSPASPCRRAWASWCTATSEDEQAVSSAMTGPCSPRVKATRPMAVLALVPVVT